MSVALDYASLRNSSAVKVMSTVLADAFNPAVMSGLEGRPVLRSPGQLRLHRALEELGWTRLIGELNEAITDHEVVRHRADSGGDACHRRCGRRYTRNGQDRCVSSA
jgi:hypothetical protein